MTQHLSIVYITLNAEKYLQQSLQISHKLSNDIVIIDSGSSDNTLNIAKHASAKVIHQDWLGFAAQKQLAIDSAKHNWVLFLDADEVLSDQAVSEIQNIFSNKLNNATAYSLPRQNFFQGKWIKHGSWWPDRVTRLVNRSKGSMRQVRVHECWETGGEVEKLQSPIKHYSYDNYSQLIQKADTYSSLAARELLVNNKKCSKWAPLNHAIASFIRLFIIKRGFLDGIEGAAIAYTSALASFMKYAKLQELQSNKKAS